LTAGSDIVIAGIYTFDRGVRYCPLWRPPLNTLDKLSAIVRIERLKNTGTLNFVERGATKVMKSNYIRQVVW